MIRHVIFDLDGTLIDSCATCVAILSDMLEERGADYAIDPGEARGYMSRGGLEMVRGLLGPACTDPDADLAEFRARYRSRSISIDTLFPGVAEGLQRMQQGGLTLSICSNKPQALCEKVVNETQLADYFALVVGGQSRLRPKPAPDLLDALLAGLGATPAECLFVGDSELDHEIAREAAIPFHLVSYGYAAENWAPEDCTTFDSFHCLTDLVIANHVHA